MASDGVPSRRGRRSAFKTEYVDQARKYCLLGATDAQLADFFGVDERTINRWKQRHPEFCQSLKEGKAEADARVAESLYRRALGYTHPAEDIRVVDDAVVRTETEKHYPPDTTACIFWLKNRQPAMWRDKVAVSGDPDGPPIRTEEVNRDPEHLTELARRIAFILEGAAHERKKRHGR